MSMHPTIPYWFNLQTNPVHGLVIIFAYVIKGNIQQMPVPSCALEFSKIYQ